MLLVLGALYIAPAGAEEHGGGARATIMIHDVYELQNMSHDLNGSYELANTIDASGTKDWDAGKGFDSVGSWREPFNGTLEGRGHTIYDLFICRPDQGDGMAEAGLIEWAGTGSVIKNVTISRSDVTGRQGVGSLVGSNSGAVENCVCLESLRLHGNPDLPDSNIGGLVGENHGTIRGCLVQGSVDASSGISGGLVGLNERTGRIENCTVRAGTTGTNSVGGIVGNNSGLLTDSNNTGPVTGQRMVGGLVAENGGGTIASCTNEGEVRGDSYVGGITAYSVGRIRDCVNTGTVQGGSDNCTGGIVAHNWKGFVSGCFNTGTITGSNETGGVVGANLGNVSRCFNSGPVTGTNTVGGVAGRNDNQYGWMGVMEDCYNTGLVAGTSEVGGLVGALAFWVRNIGPGLDSWGGNISRAYSAGVVRGASATGGLVGTNSLGSVDVSYWDTQASGCSTSVCGAGKTTAEMRRQATFAGWDFESVWKIDEGSSYPYLRDMPSSAVNNPPSILTTPPTGAFEGTPYSVQFAAMDADQDALSWAMTSNTSWLSMTAAGLLFGTPDRSDLGISNVTVIVSDGRGRQAQITFDITVSASPANHDPVWSSVPSNTTLVEGADFNFNAAATDVDAGDVVSYGLTTSPACGLTVNTSTGRLEWLDVSVGDYACVLTATDGHFVISHVFGLKATKKPAVQPTILSVLGPENITVKASSVQTFSVEASSPSNATLTYDWKENGVTLSTEKTFSRKFAPGKHSLILLIGDGQYTTSRTFNFTVAQPPKTTEPKPFSTPGFEAGIAVAAISAVMVAGLFWRRERR